MAAPKTPSDCQSRPESARKGTVIAVKMMIPPIVGVPALAWCSCGPSSRMCWPNSRSRRNSMNFGERKMQMSRDAVPAMRTSPTVQRLATWFESAAPTASSPTPRDAFTSTVSPGSSRSGTSAAASAASATACVAPAERRPHRGGQRADGDEHVHARAPRRGRRSPRGSATSSGPSSSMSPSTATRRPAGGLGEVVEGRPHGHRVRVVAVVDDDDPARERDLLAAQARERDRDLPRHRRRRPRARPPTPRACWRSGAPGGRAARAPRDPAAC